MRAHRAQVHTGRRYTQGAGTDTAHTDTHATHRRTGARVQVRRRRYAGKQVQVQAQRSRSRGTGDQGTKGPGDQGTRGPDSHARNAY